MHVVTIIYLSKQFRFQENDTSQMGLAFVNRSVGKARLERQVQCMGIRTMF